MTDSPKKEFRIGIISSMYACKHEGKYYFHLSFGRVIDRLVGGFKEAYISIPVKQDNLDHTRDYGIGTEWAQIIEQPFYAGSLGALKYFFGIVKAYYKVCRGSDLLFIRGIAPYVGILYLLAKLFRCRVCHWIVGDPITLLRSHSRRSRLYNILSMLYAFQDRFLTRLGRWLVDGSFICNGAVLAGKYNSAHTRTVVSSTITKDEFHPREDTCRDTKIKILFIGFIRPEKGLQYLFRAVSDLNIDKPWELILVGSSQRYGTYKIQLEQLAASLGISQRIKWAGYISYGREMFECFQNADIFVLPTLSEGTPRVLIEARANSIPIIASKVGGIPTSVSDEHDGLLVEPKDSVAIKNAIERIVKNTRLRQNLIRNGLITAGRFTLEHFIEEVFDEFDNMLRSRKK